MENLKMLDALICIEKTIINIRKDLEGNKNYESKVILKNGCEFKTDIIDGGSVGLLTTFSLSGKIAQGPLTKFYEGSEEQKLSSEAYLFLNTILVLLKQSIKEMEKGLKE